MVERNEPVEAREFELNPLLDACPRAGRPARVSFPRLHEHPAGEPPGGMIGLPPGGVKVKLQFDAKPKSAAV